MAVGPLNSNSRTKAIKFLYSYGGKILPRHTDWKLRYVGGHTRVLTVERSISFAELLVKLGESCGSSVSLRCQLPTDDLDALVSITCDEDLANVIEEYDRASSSSHQPLKIRAILSPPKSLKKVSPSPSTTSSNDLSPSCRSPFAVFGSFPADYRFVRRISTPPPVGIPVCVHKKDAGQVRYYPCHVQADPRHVYRAPHWNH